MTCFTWVMWIQRRYTVKLSVLVEATTTWTLRGDKRALKNEDYEAYFDKFSDYLVKVNEDMKGYGAVLGAYSRLGDVPMKFNVHGEEYTFTDDYRVCCDNVECYFDGTLYDELGHPTG